MVGFEHIFESYASSVIRKGTTVVLRHATSFSPSRIRNFVSYFIHDTLRAYPSVTQLKKHTLLTFSFYTSFGRRLTSPKRNVSSSWRCLLQIFLGCSKRSNYRVSTPFVFLRDSSVTIMRCGPNLTQASGKQSYLTEIQVITGHQSHVTSLW